MRKVSTWAADTKTPLLAETDTRLNQVNLRLVRHTWTLSLVVGLTVLGLQMLHLVVLLLILIPLLVVAPTVLLAVLTLLQPLLLLLLHRHNKPRCCLL